MTDSPGTGGWHPDPTRRFEFRWHNGQQWTADVAVGGQRFVDPAGAGMGPAATAPQFGTQFGPPAGTQFAPQFEPEQHPGRGLGIASFVVGLCSALLGWVPFVVALAAAGAIVAFILGVVAVRRIPSGGSGRRLAVAGIVLSVVAAGMCVLGVVLTGHLLDELDRLADVGDYRAEVSCLHTDGLVDINGSLTNLDDVSHSYVITIAVTDKNAGTTVDERRLSLERIDAGVTTAFTSQAFVDDGIDVECTVRDVSGPTLFNQAP